MLTRVLWPPGCAWKAQTCFWDSPPSAQGTSSQRSSQAPLLGPPPVSSQASPLQKAVCSGPHLSPRFSPALFHCSIFFKALVVFGNHSCPSDSTGDWFQDHPRMIKSLTVGPPHPRVAYPRVPHSWLQRADWVLFACFLVLSRFSPKLRCEPSSGGLCPVFLHGPSDKM